MIGALEYLIHGTRAYLSRADKMKDGALSFSFPTVEDGWLTLGGANYKISHGAVSIPISRLRDGVHRASVNTSDCRVELIPIRAQNGVISLHADGEEIARIERELYSLSLLTKELSERTVSLETAVFGTKIF